MNRMLNDMSKYLLAMEMNRAFRRARTVARAAKLNDAVRDGFLVNTNVILSNGVRGRIVKINRTRVRVQATDGRMWSVPPGCMVKA